MYIYIYICTSLYGFHRSVLRVPPPTYTPDGKQLRGEKAMLRLYETALELKNKLPSYTKKG